MKFCTLLSVAFNEKDSCPAVFTDKECISRMCFFALGSGDVLNSMKSSWFKIELNMSERSLISLSSSEAELIIALPEKQISLSLDFLCIKATKILSIRTSWSSHSLNTLRKPRSLHIIEKTTFLGLTLTLSSKISCNAFFSLFSSELE